MKFDEENRQNVTVTDIHMPFSSMVVFMVKWAIAAIPAFIILTAISLFTWSILGGLLHSWTLSNQAIKIGSEARTPFPAEESAYLGKIIVKGVTVGPTTLDGKGVFGEVKNDGNRAVSKVEIKIYCLDKKGAPIFEKSSYPVLISSLSFGDSNVPLKPGYSRKFGVKIDDAPSEWNGKVLVKVTEIAFSNS